MNFNYILEHCTSILCKKTSEYGLGCRYQNFKDAAKMLHVMPEKALVGMAAKHAVSVANIRDGLLPVSHCDEKCGDLVNYMILLIGLQNNWQDIENHIQYILLNAYYIDLESTLEDDFYKVDQTHYRNFSLRVIAHSIKVWEKASSG